MKRAAIYVRISQDREGQGLGVARQEQDCRELAGEMGFDVGEVYCDNDESAHRRKPRPHFVRLLEDVRRGGIDAIIAWHTDRIYRRPRDLQSLIEAMGVHDVSLHTVKSGSLDLTTAQGRANAHIFASISNLEVELKSERQKRKELQSAVDGIPRTSVRAFGFEKDGMTWREAEAVMIQQATADVLAGTSLSAIIRRWNASGYTTSRGRPWNHNTVKLVLTRWRNAGLRERNIRDAANQIVRTDLHPGTWEGLVTRSQLEAVRNKLFDPKRRTSPGDRVRRHLLSYFLVCGECGGQMRAAHSKARSGKTYLTYQCGGLLKNSQGTNCRMGIMYEIAEEVVRSHVAVRLARPDPALLSATSEARAAFESIHGRRAAIEERRAEIHAAEVDDLDKLPMLKRVKAELDDLAYEFERLVERGAVGETMRGLFLEPEPLATKDSATGFVVDVLEYAAAMREAQDVARFRFDALDLSVQRQVLQALVRVTVLAAEPGRQYRGNRELSMERIRITDLDPASGEPIEGSAT